MDGVGFQIDGDHPRVRLKDTVDPSVYGDYACVGNEGWIENRRTDRFNLPEVLITWDKDHWAYNGVPDCWTFEEHFELVKDNMDKNEAAQQAALEFANKMAELFGAQQPQKEKTRAMDLTQRMVDAGNIFSQPERETDEYDTAVAAVNAQLAESEAFIVIGAEKDRQGRLSPFALGFARSPKAELAVEAHLALMTARAHQELIFKAIDALESSDA